MSKVTVNLRVLTVALALVFASGAVRAQHEHHSETEAQTPPAKAERTEDANQTSTKETATTSPKTVEPEKTPPVSAIGLAELERMALENNPTLKQADFAVRAAEGRKIQAGLLPNPVVGFTAEDLSFRNFGRGGKVGFFVEQRIPLGGKLAKSRRVFEQEINLAEAGKNAQRARVMNSVRLLYLEALGAQAVMDLKKDLAKLAGESTEVSAELNNVGLADRPDRLKAEIVETRAEAEYLEALAEYEEAWQKLGAMIGKPGMPPVRLAGNIADFPVEIDTDELLTRLLAESPEVKAAELKAERARLAVSRARAEKTPDLYLRGGVGYNREIIADAPFRRRAGAEGFLEIGVSLPIFDRNQGGIKTAEAELGSAEREVERLRLVLQTRYAEVLKSYRVSAFRADRYRTAIVPKAKAAYEMYEVNFRNMTAPYTSVLSTRAAYLEAQIEYAQSLTAARQSIVLLKGFLLAGGLSAPDEAGESALRVPAATPPSAGGDEQ